MTLFCNLFMERPSYLVVNIAGWEWSWIQSTAVHDTQQNYTRADGQRYSQTDQLSSSTICLHFFLQYVMYCCIALL